MPGSVDLGAPLAAVTEAGTITAERATKLKDRLPKLVTRLVHRVPKAR